MVLGREWLGGETRQDKVTEDENFNYTKRIHMWALFICSLIKFGQPQQQLFQHRQWFTQLTKAS